MNNSRKICGLIFLITIAAVTASLFGCAFAEGVFEDYIGQQHYLYNENFTAWLERENNEDWMYNIHMPSDYNGELGYVIEDLDQDGAEELLSVGTVEVTEWDEYWEVYRQGTQLRVTVLEQDGTQPCESVLPISAAFNTLASPWDDSTEKPICGLLRVYLYGKEPYIMVESYDFENTRGDGRAIDYFILKYDGKAIRLLEENGYAGSDYLSFDPEYVIGLAQNGIGCVDFYSVYLGDGLIQAIDDYTPVAGLITRTIISHVAFDSWRENGSGKTFDVSETHVFSCDELNRGVLKKLWDGGNADPDPLSMWVEPSGSIEAATDLQIRSLPSLNGKVIGILKAGNQADYLDITLEDERGAEWNCILAGNTYGWISDSTEGASYASERGNDNTMIMPSTQTVKQQYVHATGDVNIRTAPDKNSGILGTLKKGKQLEYANETRTDNRGIDWYEVMYNGNYGWISSMYSLVQ